jgi:hypothetical protein
LVERPERQQSVQFAGTCCVKFQISRNGRRSNVLAPFSLDACATCKERSVSGMAKAGGETEATKIFEARYDGGFGGAMVF